jgi:predicted ATPase
VALSETDALLEREREAALLETLVRRAADGRGGLAMVEGAAGLGKTRLLRHAAQLAEAASVRVLSASGSELEHEFAFGAVRQLLEAHAVLEGAAELAAPALGLPSAVAAEDRH